ncbi:MAG: hypothetical protein AVDCRST_MAG76-2992 [uncultured Acidimicrobiales bacterium]|uniref:ABC-type glycine betaine transport system substrate-binding domain-containing protein n=1 Tax=uncultured Acidimicrobiales bacterium TaxID=310071 RepID=A0A6J4IWR8_9ACTN|nr:MAG: hypothetical protein AVDCRST_MAG76-2992 [uncultured Acidimicrobiales bacterium]
MSPGLKSLAAVVAAAAMVGAAVVGRGALDTKNERDDLRLTVACDPLARAFCESAAAADPRLTVKVEAPDVTTKRLVGLSAGERPDVQAWVSVGPWLQMADGRRPGQARLQRGEPDFVSSTPLVLVTRTNQNLGSCGRPPAGCLPLPTHPVGLPSPRSSGVGLAGLAQVVLATTGTAAADLDRSVIESGSAVGVIDALERRTNPNAGLEQLNANFAQANPLVTTGAAAAPAGNRASVVSSDPAVRAVLQVGLLDEAARVPMGGAEPAGRALARAAAEAGWDPPGDPAGGLPDPGVLAALQDAWRGP